ncbi:DUF4326 domain-containing protein [Nonomuraea sp. NPDC050790]|uniref:DUF4326 domain-containing protein n=1 Tax=Nonomuraea sp. NPDC050790 TaxID=3364371 RepID=UPI0037B09B16
MPETRTPKRIQRKRTRGWKRPDNCVIVDRTSKYGNPWAVTLDPGRGWRVHPAGDKRLLSPDIVGWWANRADAAAQAVSLYSSWFRNQPELVELACEELPGKDLACPCPLPESVWEPDHCHAAFLIDFVRELCDA